jgi:hypothetical protein
MLKKFLIFGVVVLCAGAARADDAGGEYFRPHGWAQDIAPLQCAQRVFQNALAATSSEVIEDVQEDIEDWVMRTFHDREVNSQVMACIGPMGLSDDELVIFPPVGYRFPPVYEDDENPREIIVNYRVSKQILRQRAILSEKRDLPPGGPTERVGPDAEWANTEPAWYGIMVVQADSMLPYAGPGRYNTISQDYIRANLPRFYPRNYNDANVLNLGGLASLPMCTSKSVLANHSDIVSMAARRTTGETKRDEDGAVESDTNVFGFAIGGNKYYVAGDVNMQWITWAQVTAEVALIAATWGTGAAVTASAKGARSMNSVRNLRALIGSLKKVDKVDDFRRTTKHLANLEKRVEAVRTYDRAMNTARNAERNMRTLQNSGNATETAIRAAQTRLDDAIFAADRARGAMNVADRTTDSAAAVRSLNDQIAAAKRTIGELESIADVKKYKEATKALGDVLVIARNLRAFRRLPQTGNVVARSWRATRAYVTTVRAIGTGGRTLRRAERIGRAGVQSGKVRNWLFIQSRKLYGGAGRAASGAAGFGALGMGWQFLQGLYDWTETEVDDFTSGVPFKSLLLLSANDLKEHGQENIINHGMWLMWKGDSTSPADDDAAFLQAMDFAAKFHQDMEETQEDYITDGRNRGLCDVDIYVVRPILRNPSANNPQLYYLIMNDQPWRVRQ